MTEWDVVVVGGGLAGLSAAVASAERGARVAVLERGSERAYPCNSRVAMGFLTIAGLDSRSRPELLRAAIDRTTGGEADPALADALAQDAGAAFVWLRRQGARFIQFGAPGARKPVLAPLVKLRPGLNWQGRGADVMMRRLEARLEAFGGSLLRGHAAIELSMAADRCTGVIADTPRGRTAFAARAVVLADGGFQADPAQVERFAGARPGTILQRNTGSGRGDGLRMAEAAGAGIVATTQFYGHVQSRDAMTNDRLWPYPVLDIPITAGIAVDAAGRRFTDEGLGGIAVANAIAALPDPLASLAVFDQAIWEGPSRQLLVAPNPNLERAGGTLHRADDLATLARLAGIDPAGLLDTVGAYNEAIGAGTAQSLPVPRSSTFAKPMPILKAPFYAAPVCAGITYTMGGIAIDEHARVRNRNGDVIPGLFAAGSTTGGHEGGSLSGYTGGLTKAAVFGLRAAASIARAAGLE